MTLIICGPRGPLFRAIKLCPTCKTRRRFVVRAEAWYGDYWHCCHCGDVWNEGEPLMRPFKPRWRAEAARKHQEMWKTAGTRKAAMAWLMADVMAS